MGARSLEPKQGNVGKLQKQKGSSFKILKRGEEKDFEQEYPFVSDPVVELLDLNTISAGKKDYVMQR